MYAIAGNRGVSAFGAFVIRFIFRRYLGKIRDAERIIIHFRRGYQKCIGVIGMDLVHKARTIKCALLFNTDMHTVQIYNAHVYRKQ